MHYATYVYLTPTRATNNRTISQLHMHFADNRYAYKGAVLNTNATGDVRKIQTVWLLTEAGLYKFLMAARNKLAKVFSDWVCFDVIPSIRRTGKYEVSDDEQKQLKASNKALQQRLQETEKHHKEAQKQLEADVTRLKDAIQMGVEDMKQHGHEMQELNAQLEALRADKETETTLIAKLEEERSKHAERYAALHARSATDKSKLKDTEDDLCVVTGYLKTFGGVTNVAAVLTQGFRTDKKAASDPMVNRNQLITLRCGSFAILHTCSFMIVKGWQECHGRKMNRTEVEDAVNSIMEVSNAVVPVTGRTNWITLYTVLASIAKKRLGGGDRYSTEMPVSHLYLYARNLNAWAQKSMKMAQCVSYDKEIEAFYGKTAVASFAFERVNYDEIQASVENRQPRITAFF